MPTPSAREISLSFDGEANLRFRELVRVTESTPSQVVRNALRLYEAMLDMSKQGVRFFVGQSKEAAVEFEVVRPDGAHVFFPTGTGSGLLSKIFTEPDVPFVRLGLSEQAWTRLVQLSAAAGASQPVVAAYALRHYEHMIQRDQEGVSVFSGSCKEDATGFQVFDPEAEEGSVEPPTRIA